MGIEHKSEEHADQFKGGRCRLAKLPLGICCAVVMNLHNVRNNGRVSDTMTGRLEQDGWVLSVLGLVELSKHAGMYSRAAAFVIMVC